MRKSTIFISVVLTTFALAMLYGVVSAYRNVPTETEVSAMAIETATLEPTADPTATSAIVTPEEAAQLAAQVVGNTNLLSAETSSFNGVDAYLITFTNNDVVYVGIDGQILGVQVAPVVMNVAPPVKVKKNNDGGGDSASVQSQGEHEDHEDEDHEEQEEHEDDD